MNGSAQFGWILVVAGLVVAAAGLLWVFAPGFLRPGRLPGDISIARGNARFYFPIVTCIVISVVLSLLSWLINMTRR